MQKETWEKWTIWQISEVEKELRRHLLHQQQRQQKQHGARGVRLFTLFMDRAAERLQKDELDYLTKEEVVRDFFPNVNLAEKIPSTVDTALRALKGDLKNSLEKFASSDAGRRLPVSVLVTENRWGVEIEKKSCAMKRFWEPYFKCDRVTIAYAESVFFRGGEDARAFVRHMDVNDKEEVTKIQSRCELPNGWIRQKGGLLFVAAGDTAAVIDLVQQFEKHGVRTNVIKAQLLDNWTPQQNEGLIVLGNGRTIPWLATRLKEEGFTFQIADDKIVDTRRTDNPPDDFSESYVRGIVARKKSTDWNCWLTIIAGNHGRCSEGWVKYLFAEDELTRFFAHSGWNPNGPIPEQFELYDKIPIDREEILKPVPARVVPLKPECVTASSEIQFR